MNMEIDYDEDDESIPSLLEFMPSDVILDIFKFVDWNDICQLSRTCTKFNEICHSATLWLGMKRLDFRNVVVPDATKILKILEKTTNAEHVLLGDVIMENEALAQHARVNEEDGTEAEDEGPQQNVIGPDKFVLDVLKTCPHLKCIDLHMHEISDRAVEAICAKCPDLDKLCIHYNKYINREAIKDLVSHVSSLKELCLDSCEGITFPSITHSDTSKHLNITKISLLGMMLVSNNVQTLMQGCPNLRYLDLTGAEHLDRFSVNIPEGRKSGLDTLENLVIKDCKYVQLVSIPYCPCLQTIDLSHSERITEVMVTCPRLSRLDTEGCVNITKVEMTSSDVTELCCSEMEDLRTLAIGSSHLNSLDVSNCTKLTADQIVTAITDKSSIFYLNICGCKGVPPADVDNIILPELTGLRKLKYGGHSWNSVRLKSNSLLELEYSTCTNTTCVQLNMPSLHSVLLHKCRDFSEQEFIDSFLHGRQIQRMQGLESLIENSCKDPPFLNNSGLPQLHTIKCHDLPGLHGDVISQSMKYFQHLTSLEFDHCISLSRLNVNGWPSLTSLRLDSCNRLSSLSIDTMPTLKALDVRWCSMVQQFTLIANNLKHLDVTGTNFAHVHVICDNLDRLAVNGVCTQTQHTMYLRCRGLQQLSITKCDRLTDEVVKESVEASPYLTSLCLISSLSLRNICIPSSITVCSLTGHRILREITLQAPISVKHLTLNNLPKLLPVTRQKILAHCEASLRILEVRAIPGETTLSLQLRNLTSLTLDQGIHLAQLEINCPKLQYLRIQGCPKLHTLCLHVDNLSQVQVYHSTPLLALKSFTLHCAKVTYLSSVLALYCPKLENLQLHRSELRASQLYKLGQSLYSLHSLHLHDCVVRDLDVQTPQLLIESDVINRSEGKHLTVHFLSL